MNLHGIVRGVITAVNPDSVGVIRRNAGTYTTAADGTQVPTYAADVTGVGMQIQPLSSRDLRWAASMNLTDIDVAVYVFGEVTGIDRKDGKGGDLVQVNSSWWLVAAVIEAWNPTAGWTKAGLVKQLVPA